MASDRREAYSPVIFRRAGLLVVIVFVLTSVGSSVLAQLAGPAPGNASFQQTWDRTDKPVNEYVATRTWMWGAALTDARYEAYAQSPDGQREIQYFDKSRMEITFPDSDPSSVWYVTNGLLVTEMVTGQIQLGDTDFQWIGPAEINVAGDQDDPDSPTYATFAGLMERAPDRTKLLVQEWLDREGNVQLDYGLESERVWMEFYDDVTGHNVAWPFWYFMISRGMVWQNGEFVQDKIFQDPFFATGRPITEAYWANVNVAGTEMRVMMQCFERRCMTYTPSNDPEWQVEAGNVGQHYYGWRYEGAGRPPPAKPGGEKLAFLSGEVEKADVWSIDRSGLNGLNLTWEPELNLWRSHQHPVWSPDGSQIAFVRNFLADGVPRADIYVMNADGSNVRPVTSDPARAYGPLWSPDGTQLVFGSWRSGGGNLYIVNSDGTGLRQFTSGPGHDEVGGWSEQSGILIERSYPGGEVPSGDILIQMPDSSTPREVAVDPASDRTPVWSPDGAKVAFMSTRSGDADIWVVNVDGTGLQILTTDTEADHSPFWSPDGQQIVYACGGFEGSDICAVNSDGTGQRTVTGSEATDAGPVWSPDGGLIAFVSNRDGNKNIYLVAPDGSDLTQLTTDPLADFNPVWSP